MSPNCKMGYKDPRTAELVQFLKGKVGIQGLPIWSEFLKRGSTDGQIGPNFQRGKWGSTNRRFGPNFKKGIHGRPNRSIFKGESRDPGTADLIRILKKGSTNG